MKMICPHLSESYILSCKADLGVYVPSLFELNQFCQSDRHTVCPYYSLVDNGPPTKERDALPCDCIG